MKYQTLVPQIKKRFFAIGPYDIVSQEPSALVNPNKELVADTYLPAFIILWKAIEDATGHRWKCTSFIRNSPSHKKGHSFDLAPDIAKSDENKYAVTHMSDPVLYKRERMIRQLQTLKNLRISPDFDMGIFIEPDHLHIQVLNPGDGSLAPVNIVKWGQPKPIYKDTMARSALPLFRS